jgi:hypothetical protein
MADAKRIVAHGGLVRFTYKTTLATLVSFDSNRSINSIGAHMTFLRSIAPQLSRIESGSVETGDLVIAWGQ